VINEGGRFVIIILKDDATELILSEIVKVSGYIPPSDVRGDIVIYIPLNVTGKGHDVEIVITTFAPSGSVSTGKVYVDVIPATIF
jgi:hypothetical protein